MPDGSNAFLFRPAVRENTPMVMALAGASGSGKTFTALELAMGLADGGKIAVIDTEGRRALHYADVRGPDGAPMFRFDHCELRPPFSPDRFLEAMKAAEAAGYRVIVIDSFSDEHEGEGGLIDMAAAGRSENTAANWARPKAAHKLIVRWLRQARCHVIFCLRAEERVRLEKVYDERKQREVTAVVPIGWWPIAEKRFMYDMTASFLLSPTKPGIPEPIKLQEQHRRYFPEGKPVTRESGRQLATWAAGGAPAPQTEGPTLEERARDAAEGGRAALDAFWKSLGRDERAQIVHLIVVDKQPGELARRAAEVDARRDEPPENIPFDTAEQNSAAGQDQPSEQEKGVRADGDRVGTSAPAGDASQERAGSRQTHETAARTESAPQAERTYSAPADAPRDRDEAFWNGESYALDVPASDPRAFQAAMHAKLREARHAGEVIALRDANGQAIDALPKAYREDVLGAMMDREKALRGAARG